MSEALAFFGPRLVWTRGLGLYIMLLDRQGKGEVAERRGVGSISKDAITKGFQPGPVWKEILLA